MDKVNKLIQSILIGMKDIQREVDIRAAKGQQQFDWLVAELKDLDETIWAIVDNWAEVDK